MSSQILNIKQEEVDSAEKREKYTVCIIGCGQVGVFLAYLFADAGFKVKCVDVDQIKVDSVTLAKVPFLERETELKLKNFTQTGRLTATTDIKTAVSQSDIITITISMEIDKKKKPDYSKIENACKQVGLSLRRGSFIILTSIVGVGVTEGLIREIIENTSGLKTGEDFGLAYCPINTIDAQTLESLKNREQIVAAKEKRSLNAASIVFGIIAKKGVKVLNNVKIAEAVALLKTARLNVNVALAKEIAIFCEKSGLDYLETSKFLRISDYDLLSLSTLADENFQTESYILLEEAENLNINFRMPVIASEINEDSIKHAINLIKETLKICGKPLRRAKISVLGFSQIPNRKTPPKKMAEELVQMLNAKGAKVSLYDPYLSGEKMSEIEPCVKKSLNEVLEGADCIFILTGHDQFKRLNPNRLKVMMKMPAAIVDFERIIEPDKVEKEGLIYRGLGRGA